jgi:hypothetical protein
MGQTRDETTQNLAEQLRWEVARRDDTRIARRLYRKQVVDGVYRLDEGAVLDDFFYFLDQLGVMALLAEIHGAAVQREMIPFVQYVLLYSLKRLFGIESINALPVLLFSDEALMQLVGFNAQQVDTVCASGRPPSASWRPCSMESFAPWPRPRRLANRSPTLPMARTWRPPRTIAPAARRPARSGWKISTGRCTRLR